MRAFILGIILTIVVIVAVGLFVLETGRVNMRADVPPSSIETRLAGHAMDASVDRNAPKLANPIQATDANVFNGAKIYAIECAQCHGDLNHPKSLLAETLNPPPPQFFGGNRPDMPENQNYYITAHGVRLTGMPGWKNALTNEQIWQVVTFLSHLDNLPPAAKSILGLSLHEAPAATKQQ